MIAPEADNVREARLVDMAVSPSIGQRPAAGKPHKDVGRPGLRFFYGHRGAVPVDDVDLDSVASAQSRRGRGACVIELRIFGGLTAEETAEVLGVSRRLCLTTGSSPKPGCSASF